jgi:hypothetical protein
VTHILDYTPIPRYERLPLLQITGALAILFLFLVYFCLHFLIVEIILNKCSGDNMETGKEFQTFSIDFMYNIYN